MTRILTLLIAFVLGLASGFVAPARADGAARLAEAMIDVRNGDWEAATRKMRGEGPIARDIIEWQRLRAGKGSYAEVMAFLKRRPDWPGLPLLRRKSEAMLEEASDAQVLTFFAEDAPRTAAGVLRQARALINDGHPGDASANLVLAWRTMPMSARVQAAYLADHAKLLKPHNEARLDRMLWDRQRDSARLMLPLMDGPHRALAAARLALQERAKGVDARIAAVPERLRNDPGLARDRFEWRVRKGRKADAKTLLLERSTSVEALGEPEAWARRRRDLARDEMRNGDSRRAYRLASRHYLTEGPDFADLEWLSGYLALRRLNDPATALKHFKRFDGAVASPISKGRAGYWIGRAQEALGNKAAARASYAEGARFQSSFYGLLAAERANVPFDRELANPPHPPSWRGAAFTESPVLKAGLLLLAADEIALGNRFITHLIERLSPVEAAQLGEMALDMDRPHLAVLLGKRVARSGRVLPGPYYAVHAVGRMKLPMAPEMVLAIARRESEFNPGVISGAGARGLMQVMPATARLVARDLGVLKDHSTGRLTADWRYNARLGATYLAGLAGKFDGNVVMMAAGYNAGPNRPPRWMDLYGDPRTGRIDIIDWIEMIPFNETRNYVMRVTESLPVYRARLGKPALPIPFSRELAGSTLRAFAPKGE